MPLVARVTFQPRVAYIHTQLKERCGETDRQAVINSLQFYLALLRANEDQMYFFAGLPGKKPFPIALLRPGAVIDLPPEASAAKSLSLKIRIRGKSEADFEELKRRAQAVDSEAVLENAHTLRYGILQRHERGEEFFLRNPKTRELEKAEFLKEQK